MGVFQTSQPSIEEYQGFETNRHTPSHDYRKNFASPSTRISARPFGRVRLFACLSSTACRIFLHVTRHQVWGFGCYNPSSFLIEGGVLVIFTSFILQLKGCVVLKPPTRRDQKKFLKRKNLFMNNIESHTQRWCDIFRSRARPMSGIAFCHANIMWTSRATKKDNGCVLRGGPRGSSLLWRSRSIFFETPD